MQTFDSTAGRHPFVVDGDDYYLSPYGFLEAVEFSKLAEIADTKQQIDGYRDFVASRAHSSRGWLSLVLSGQKSPRRAVMSLQPEQMRDLFSAWTGSGGTLGESSGSQSPVLVTDEN